MIDQIDVINYDQDQIIKFREIVESKNHSITKIKVQT